MKSCQYKLFSYLFSFAAIQSDYHPVYIPNNLTDSAAVWAKNVEP